MVSRRRLFYGINHPIVLVFLLKPEKIIVYHLGNRCHRQTQLLLSHPNGDNPIILSDRVKRFYILTVYHVYPFLETFEKRLLSSNFTVNPAAFMIRNPLSLNVSAASVDNGRGITLILYAKFMQNQHVKANLMISNS
jgi:hypothetical protein